MSISTKAARGSLNVLEQPASAFFPTEQALKVTGAVEEPERRAVPRFITAFRPGCVIIGGRIVLGMIRNMSTNGVMIELDEPLKLGQKVGYFWDENKLVAATVAWSEGNRHGLENDNQERVFDNRFTYRSVRVPCTLEAEVWDRGDRCRAEVDNLSLGGMRIRGVKTWTGAPLSINICGIELFNASVVWIRGNEAGVRFADRLSRSQLAAILSHESVSFDRLVFG